MGCARTHTHTPGKPRKIGVFLRWRASVISVKTRRNHHRRLAAETRYILANIVTVVWVPEYANGINNGKYAFQQRDENDFHYRARHLSEWVCPSVDLDEYFAPTISVPANRGNPCHFAVENAANASLDDATLASVFFPIHPFLERVPARVQKIGFLKWPTMTPDSAQAL
jgi:hypothetical protein